MSSPSWSDRRPSGTGTIAVLLLLLSGCGRNPSLRCDVEASRAERGTIGVTCTVSGAPDETASIKQMVPDGTVRVHDFRAEAPTGARLEVMERRDEGVGSNSRRFTERIVRSDGASDFVYRYDVEPGAWMDDAMQPRMARRFGHVDGRGGLLSGRNLFLLPSWYNRLSPIEIHFDLPKGWRAVGTLPLSDGRAHLTGAGQAAKELVDAVIGLGEFEEVSDARQGDRLHLFAGTNLPERARNAVFQVARDGFAFLEDRLGPLGHDYSIIVTERPDDGSMILVPPSEIGQGSEVAGAAPVQMYDLLFSMGRAFTAWSRPTLRLADPDRWMMEALPAYYAIRAEDALGLRSRRTSWGLRAYGAVEARSFLRGFEQAGEDGQAIARAKGAHVLAIAESILGGESDGAGALDGIIGRMKASSGRSTLLDLVKEAAPGADLSILNQLVATRGPVPAEWVAKMAGRDRLRLTRAPGTGSPPEAGRHARLLITANTVGMLEVCGCKARQMGGIARRETVRRRLAGRGDPPLLVDLGNAYTNPGDDPILDSAKESEQALALELMGREGYAMAAIGHAEMLRGPAYFETLARRRPLPYINANLSFDGRPLATPFRITRAAGVRIAWLSVLDPANYNFQHARYYEENRGGLSVDAPRESLARIARQVRPQADLVIAIGSLAPDLVREALETVPEIDAYLSTESVEAVFNTTFTFEGDTEDGIIGFRGRHLVFFSSGEGKDLEELVIGLKPGEGIVSANLTRHPLGEDVPDDPRFRDRLAGFYDGISKSPDLAGPQEPVARVLPSLVRDARYTGSAACENCHREQFEDWQATPHGFAFSVLLARHRNYAPRCVACHVTGYGLPSGYRLGDPLERLRHVQCEMCHGPGSAHVAAPSSANIVRRPPREACFECHTSEHSDMNAENFDAYYERAVHKDILSSPPDEKP